MIYLYLVLGYLLSIVAFLAYRLAIKNRIAPSQRKTYLYATVALSFLLPLLFLKADIFPVSSQHVEIIAPDEFVNDPVLDEALQSCYEKVSTQEGLCHCEQLQQSNLLYYQPNAFYNFFIQHQSTIRSISWGVVCLVLAGLCLKIGYLFFLVRTGVVEEKWIKGKRYKILRREGKFMAASFRLWHHYILWHPSLDELSEAEQKAVLLHEISHLNNGDTFEQIALSFLQIGWIINPAFYAIKKELNLINEFIADQFALAELGNPRSYASLLVKLKEQQKLGLAQHLSSNSLKDRVLAVLKPQQFINGRYMSFILTAVAAAMLAMAASTAPLASEQYALYEEYCVMHDEHEKTGKKVFCRSCLYEELLKERKKAGNTWTQLVSK